MCCWIFFLKFTIWFTTENGLFETTSYFIMQIGLKIFLKLVWIMSLVSKMQNLRLKWLAHHNCFKFHIVLREAVVSLSELWYYLHFTDRKVRERHCLKHTMSSWCSTTAEDCLLHTQASRLKKWIKTIIFLTWIILLHALSQAQINHTDIF